MEDARSRKAGWVLTMDRINIIYEVYLYIERERDREY